MFYGKPDINGRTIEFESTSKYRVLHAGNCKFPRSEEIREFLEPRIQAITNSFQESKAFKSIMDQLGEGSIIGGSLVAKLAGEGVSTNSLKVVDKFIAIEACYAIFKPVRGARVKIYLNSEYLAGFCDDKLRIFEVPEFWTLSDLNLEKDEVDEITHQNSMNCELCKSTFGLDVSGHGIIWYEDKMLDPEIVRS